jgi:hypothetical protein
MKDKDLELPGISVPPTFGLRSTIFFPSYPSEFALFSYCFVKEMLVSFKLFTLKPTCWKTHHCYGGHAEHIMVVSRCATGGLSARSKTSFRNSPQTTTDYLSWGLLIYTHVCDDSFPPICLYGSTFSYRLRCSYRATCHMQRVDCK